MLAPLGSNLQREDAESLLLPLGHPIRPPISRFPSVMDLAVLLNPMPEAAAAAETLMLLTTGREGGSDPSEPVIEIPPTAVVSSPTHSQDEVVVAQLSPMADKRLASEGHPSVRPLLLDGESPCSPDQQSIPVPHRFCRVAGCLREAVRTDKCVVHKGMKLCGVAGCCRPVQSRGACKSHGGGARCKHPACGKGAISKGRCRSHGGGTRCAVPSCSKWAQRLGCCVRHSKMVRGGWSG